jgi:hypothetical protein
MSESCEHTPAKQNARRRPFGTEEDAVIMRMMLGGAIHGWEAIARRLPGRTARQCRERWTNYLSPSVRSEPWTVEEDHLLVEKVNEVKFSWSVIARSFNGRSDNDIKNRWYSHLKHETVHDGERYVFPGSDPESGVSERKKRNRVKTYPKQNAMRLIEQQQQQQHAWPPRIAMPMITRPKPPDGAEADAGEVEDVWDGIMLEEGADEDCPFEIFE